jgi:hypothetical protein
MLPSVRSNMCSVFSLPKMGLTFTMSQLVEKHWVLDKDIINESTGSEKAYMRVK